MKNNNAKYAFYYLLSLVALIFTAVSAGIIFFQTINKNIIDVLLDYNYINESALRFSISALIVAVPVFFIIVRLINRGLKNKEIEKDSPIRRWLTYFILFVSAIIILGSLVGVLNSFLSGEMTLKFVLKILTLIVISGLVFSYYFYDIKRDDVEKKDKNLKIFFWLSFIFILATFVLALFSVESPSLARDRKADQKTLSSIYNLENIVNSYYNSEEELPENMEALLNFGNFSINTNDFEGIEYKKIDDSNFEMCANFKTDSLERGFRSPYGDKNFSQGYSCFKGILWIEKK